MTRANIPPQATFAKRKAGLLKKAMELSVLCGADVAVVVFDARGQRYEGGFLAQGGANRGGGADAVLARRAAATAAHTAAAQTTGTAELLRKYHGAEGVRRGRDQMGREGGASSGGDDEAEEEDDDEEGGDDSGSSPPRKRVRYTRSLEP